MSEPLYWRCSPCKRWVPVGSSCTGANCQRLRAYKADVARRTLAASNVKADAYSNTSFASTHGGAPAIVASSSTNSNRAPPPPKQPKPLPVHLSYFCQRTDNLWYCPSASCKNHPGMRRNKLQKHHDRDTMWKLQQAAYAKQRGDVN